jgi:hypothetical protein
LIEDLNLIPLGALIILLIWLLGLLLLSLSLIAGLLLLLSLGAVRAAVTFAARRLRPEYDRWRRGRRLDSDSKSHLEKPI